MPIPLPMRLFLAALAVAAIVTAAGACSSDPVTGSGDDATVDTNPGDLNTDLFDPPDGGGDAGADLDNDSAGGGEDSGGGEDGEDSGEETLDRYESCGFGGPQCTPPLTCVGNCQLPCSAGCPEGEECIDLGDFAAAGVCGVRGAAGDDCDFTHGLFCAEGLFCEAGICAAVEVGGEGDDCGGFGEQCADGFLCVFTGFGEGYCSAECQENVDCEEGEVCLRAGFSGNVCYEDCDGDDEDCSDPVNFECRTPTSFPGGGGGGDDACLPRRGPPPGDVEFGEPCGDGANCVAGLFCPGLGGSYCTKSCSDVSECPTEPAGVECVSVGLGICSFTCPGGNDSECPEGMTCNDIFGQQLCAWP